MVDGIADQTLEPSPLQNFDNGLNRFHLAQSYPGRPMRPALSGSDSMMKCYRATANRLFQAEAPAVLPRFTVAPRFEVWHSESMNVV
jgi:hypothetical protein